MATTIAGLASAVVLAVAYVVLAERMDEGSLARRQLDAWVFVAGVGCLLVMLTGGASVSRARHLAIQRVGMLPEGPMVVEREKQVSLYRDAIGERDAAEPEAALRAPSEARDAPLAADDGEVAVVAGGAAPYVALRGERPRVTDGPALQPPLAPVADAPLPGGVYTPALAAQPPDATPPVQAVVIAPPTARPIPPATDLPPTPAPPTPEPSPWPSPTPFCGDPRDIVVDLGVLDASIERGGEAPTVRYRAQVHNRSTFPVTLADVLVTLEGRDSGSERFGHVRLPDFQVEPSVVHALEGTMTLTKSPSPFGTTQLCVSLVTETCGQALPYHLTKRCTGARGY